MDSSESELYEEIAWYVDRLPVSNLPSALEVNGRRYTAKRHRSVTFTVANWGDKTRIFVLAEVLPDDDGNFYVIEEFCRPDNPDCSYTEEQSGYEEKVESMLVCSVHHAERAMPRKAENNG